MTFWRKLIVCSITIASIVPFQGDADAASPIPIYVFAGQSNMVGAFARAAELPAHDPQLSLPNERALFYGPTTDLPRRWAPIEPPTEIWQSVFRSGFGPEVSAARRLVALQPGRTIGIFKFARNGTNLYYQWNASNPVSYYRYLMNRLATARAKMTEQTGRQTRIAGFFWMQGEQDSTRLKYARAYANNLRNLIATIRAETKQPKLPVVIGRIRDMRTYYRKTPYTDIVRWHQLKVAQADPYTFMVKTEGLPMEISDGVHFSTKGTAMLGSRMVRTWYGL